ncbi:3-phosphoshikimate 1-carboxyvinyltransferase [Lacticaseibacillus porcinae]|uniref:3-phosphoshikimate 1-carboxyvinyltransferase n=1 Tax=Lacticaseibacillus porcinae TaxID=1123687 RepID=UPI000F7B0DC2|nr:3-phosphoshikimate 1-carboxyvinyltransferase [Lacticaseibacillus porcinae]
MDKQLQTNVAHGLHGQLAVPGDKSISHRAIMIGSLATGDTLVHHFLTSADCLATLQAFKDLGVQIERQGDEVVVHGVGMHGLQPPHHALQMGNSGTTTRLMMGLLAGLAFDTTLIGDDSLSKRPMRRVSEPLREMGANIETTDGHLPVVVLGQPLTAAEIQLKVASAQVKSALIFAGLQATGKTVIHELLPTRDHSENMLKAFGADLEVSSDQMTIRVGQTDQLIAQTVQVPGDMSSAAFFMVAATLIPGSDVTLTNVGLNPSRRGLLDVLVQMGGRVEVSETVSAGESVGDIRVQSANLHPINLTAEQIPAIIDELPLVALLAAKADGISTIHGAEELRVKETDRIACVEQELGKLGANVKALPDGFVIDGRTPWQGHDTVLDSHGDHRIGMMLGLAALLVDRKLTLKHADAVGVSYPEFFDDLNTLLEA